MYKINNLFLVTSCLNVRVDEKQTHLKVWAKGNFIYVLY